MNKVLNGLNFTLAYLDDFIIFSETAEQHLKHIQIAVTRLKQENLKLKKSKCAFFKKGLHYLGHLLTTDGIKPQTEKIKAISEMKPHTNQKEVEESLGMVGYYRNFISRFADAARPITKLTRNDTTWSDDCQLGFEYLKTWLIESLQFSNIQIHRKDMLYSLMPTIKLQQQYSLRNAKMMTMRSKKIPVAYHSTQFFWHTTQVEQSC